MVISTALYEAERRGLDLVEIAPTANPPVCKIIDYGKFMYHEQKAQKRQHAPELKEVKFRPAIGENDLMVKVNKIIEFLGEGHKVKVTLKFKGREITHKDIAFDLFTKIKDAIANVGNVESSPKMEGKILLMVISPRKK